MKKFFRNNGLSLVFFVMFVIALIGQAFTGLKEYNQELAEEGVSQVGIGAYLLTGHFLQVTFENWESEFLQMALFVTLSISLFQKGSSESKDPDEEEEVDREPDPNRKEAPWPVGKVVWFYLFTRIPLPTFCGFYFLFRFSCIGKAASQIITGCKR
jgi:hypothetical protein